MASHTLLGLYLREQYVKLGITRAEFARRVDVKYHTVYRWERGDFRPSPKRIERIASVLQVPVDQMLAMTFANDPTLPVAAIGEVPSTVVKVAGREIADLFARAQAQVPHFDRVTMEEVAELAKAAIEDPVVKTAEVFRRDYEDVASSDNLEEAQNKAVGSALIFLLHLERRRGEATE